MITRATAPRYSVRLSVPQTGGWRARGAVSADFERRLARQHGPEVIDAHVETQTPAGVGITSG